LPNFLKFKSLLIHWTLNTEKAKTIIKLDSESRNTNNETIRVEIGNQREKILKRLEERKQNAKKLKEKKNSDEGKEPIDETIYS
jgi:hypothetical protein